MEEERAGFVRADKINIKSMDAQLEKHLHRLCSMEEKKNNNKDLHAQENQVLCSVRATAKGEEDWQIVPEKLVVKQVFARGTFGSVHRGFYNGQEVAVKVLQYWGEDGQRTKHEIASSEKDFRQEVSVWHKLDHPNITKCIGASTKIPHIKFRSNEGEAGALMGDACVITEYLPGGTLRSYLKKHRERKLPLKNVKQLALDLARGLSYLHSKNIVHRDVKSENVLLDKDGRLKIADFGVARFEASNAREMTGYTGTPGCMAPEVLESKPYNRKCDVYSFGICLWEIYCCAMPYPNIGFSELTSAVVCKNLRPEIPKHCPSSLAKLMKQCWDSEPHRRPEMEEVVSVLEAIDTTDMHLPLGCFGFFKSGR